MRAITYTKYGAPETVLRLTELPVPEPGPNEVLVRVRASAINDYDWSMVTGRPKMYRMLFGLNGPKHLVPGMEVAGTVESKGEEVSKFEIGDAVYGDLSEFGFGGLAEYVSINEKALIRKPESISFEEAATISHAAMLAYQGLIDHGELKKGQRVLINGAGGGVGTFAIQLAKRMDAQVTGVDTGSKLEMMRLLGYDHISDYKKEDFTRSGIQYDLILDCKTTRPPSHHLRSLTTNGKYVTVGGHLSRMLQLLATNPITSRLTKKQMSIVALKANKDLAYINELIDNGDLTFRVDGPYALEEVPRLIQYFGDGLHQGKIVIGIP